MISVSFLGNRNHLFLFFAENIMKKMVNKRKKINNLVDLSIKTDYNLVDKSIENTFNFSVCKKILEI